MRSILKCNTVLVVVLLALASGACFPLPGFGRPKTTKDDGGTTDAAVLDGGDAGVGMDGGSDVDGALPPPPDGGPLTFPADASVVVGPLGGRFTSLAQGLDSQVLYASADQYGGVFVAAGAGAAFAPLTLPAPMAAPVVGAPAGSVDVVLLADALGRGAYVSVNRGVAFAPVASLVDVSVQRFVADPGNPAWVLALVRGVGVTADGGAVAGGIWRSTDNGLTFAPEALPVENVHDVAVVSGGYVAATDRGVVQQVGAAITSLSLQPCVAVLPDPSSTGNYLAFNAEGQVRRVPVASSSVLQELGGAVPAGGAVVRGSQVLVASGNGLWTATGTPQDGGVAAISVFTRAVDVNLGARFTALQSLRGVTQGVVVASAGGGVRVVLGAPGAALVVQPPQGGQQSAHRCPAVLSASDGVMMGCVVEGALGAVPRVWEGPSAGVQSEPDLGAASVLPTPGGPVAVGRGADGTFYAAVGGLHRKPSGGGWVATSLLEAVFSVAPHPLMATRLVLGVTRTDGIPQVRLSDDQGNTATAVPGTLGIMPWQVAFHPSDATKALLVALPEPSWRGATPLNLERGLFETRDGFVTLVRGGPTLASGDAVSGVLVPADAPEAVLVVTGSGRVFQRETWDGAWAQVGSVSGLQVMSLAALPDRPASLVAAGIPLSLGGPALQLSLDRGATWSALNVPVPPALRVVAWSGVVDGLLVGTAGAGVWGVQPQR